MPFIELTNQDGVKISVNTDLVLYAQSSGSRARINWTNGNYLGVQESYEEVKALLPSYAVVEAIEGEPRFEEVLVDLKPTDEEKAKLEAEAAAEAARKADADNPAKKRETK